MTRTTGFLLAAGAALVLCGCTSMAGLGGSSSYACQAPEGVTCNSVSGVYANAIRNNLPGQQARASVSAPAPNPVESAAAGRRVPPSAAAARSDDLRSAPRILRLWFKPWEDADNDLFDQGYVYVQVDAGQWRVDHVQRRVREAFAPVRPPSRADAAPGAAESRGAPRAPSEIPQDPPQVPRGPSTQTGND